MQELMKARAAALLSEGKVNRVLGWAAGEFVYDVTPTVFESREELERDFVYSPFCGANLSKYLVKEARKEGKILVFLKPCDSFSFAQLVKEHRIPREKVYAVGVECYGKTDATALRSLGITGIVGAAEQYGALTLNTLNGERRVTVAEAMLEKCKSCKTKEHRLCDELLGEEGEPVSDCSRFEEVEKVEAMTPEERFAFFRGELSRCIRCNACRDVCPACTCETCVFDNPASGIAQKAAADPFEENLYHIIRAFHVAGRCTDCGECTRVCPQRIPLHLLNRKFIKDINEFYGPYQAGDDPETPSPLTDWKPDDVEPGSAVRKGGRA